MRKLSYILYLAIAFSSCGPKAIFSEKMEVDGGWEYEEKLSSTIKVVDTLKNYDLALMLNHSTEFDYQNIYVDIETIFPDGTEVSEPLSLQLAKTGKWNGKCTSGKCQILFSLQDNFKFESLGNHQITVSQFSREKDLKGVNAIELLLFESQSK